MRGTLAASGTSAAAALCCLAIPLTAGIIGSYLVAFGANLGVVAIIASAVLVGWTIRTRSRGEGEASGDR